MPKLYINFCGYVKCDPKDVQFHWIGGNDCSETKIISGEDWLALPAKEQRDYVLESIHDAIEAAEDEDWGQLTFETGEV